jgi:proteic killer suppression protein
MIVSFGDAATEDLFNGVRSARVRALPQDVTKRALHRLDALNAAATVVDLRVPPSNNLEQLAGDLEGFWSIRVNSQWRIIFKWKGAAGPSEVQLVDYH